MSRKRDLHDGSSDGLTPLESLDLDAVSSFSDLLRAMSKTAFGGRALGEALDVTTAMVKDPDCKVVLTLSGAMTIAKMGKVISKMIDAGMVQAIVSTGALMAHGLSEAMGLVHYRHDPRMSDKDLFGKGYNRVYDTLEMEANLNNVESFNARALDRLGDQLGADPVELMELVFGPYHEDTDHPWHRLERGEVDFGQAREAILALGAERGVESDPLSVVAFPLRAAGRPQVEPPVDEDATRMSGSGPVAPPRICAFPPAARSLAASWAVASSHVMGVSVPSEPRCIGLR